MKEGAESRKTKQNPPWESPIGKALGEAHRCKSRVWPFQKWWIRNSRQVLCNSIPDFAMSCSNLDFICNCKAALQPQQESTKGSSRASGQTKAELRWNQRHWSHRNRPGWTRALIRALLQSHTNTEVIFGYKAQPADLLVDLLETSENRSLKSKYFGVIVDCPEQFANNLAIMKDRQLWLKTIHNCYQEQTDCILNEIHLPCVLTYKINSKLHRVWHTKICVPKGKERNSTQENKKIFPKHVIKKRQYIQSKLSQFCFTVIESSPSPLPRLQQGQLYICHPWHTSLGTPEDFHKSILSP